MAYLLRIAAQENPHAEADAGMGLLKTQALSETSVNRLSLQLVKIESQGWHDG